WIRSSCARWGASAATRIRSSATSSTYPGRAFPSPAADRGRRAMAEIRRIAVREADVWTFTQRNVPLWDILDFFPRDAVGPRGPKDPPPAYEVKPIVIETDLGWSFESDIQYGSWTFRPRSPTKPGMMKW